MSTNGFTAASRTAGIGGTETRVAAAEARRVLLGLASERLKAPRAGSDGGQGRRVGEGRAAALGHLRRAAGGQAVQSQVRAGALQRRASSCRARAPTSRRSSRAPTTGSWARACRVPTCRQGPRHLSSTCSTFACPACFTAASCGRRARCAGVVSKPKVVSIDESSIKDIPGVRIVRRQNFVGVVAEREWDAVRAARQLKVTWEPFAGGVARPRGRSRQLPRGARRTTSSSSTRGRERRASPAGSPRRVRHVPRAVPSRTGRWRRIARSRTSRRTAPW